MTIFPSHQRIVKLDSMATDGRPIQAGFCQSHHEVKLSLIFFTKSYKNFKVKHAGDSMYLLLLKRTPLTERD